MTAEVINLETVFSGFDKGTNLDPVGVRQNNQGVKVSEVAGFIGFSATATSFTGVARARQDYTFAVDDSKIYVCVTSTGDVLATRTLTPPAGAQSTQTAGTYTSITPITTTGSGTGLVVTFVVNAGLVVTSVTVTTAGTGYATGDVVTIPAGANGDANSAAFNVTVPASAVLATFKSTAALS